MRRLEEVTRDYLDGEVTVIWLHERQSVSHSILYAVCEFRPPEQTPSSVFEGEDGLVRRAIDKTCSVYAKRWFLTVERTLQFFRGEGPIRKLASAERELEFVPWASDLVSEPPDEHLVLLDEAHSFTSVIPLRHAGVRVTSKLGPGPSGIANFEQRFGKRGIETLRKFSTTCIGVDVFAYEEHFGAIHALLPNPIARRVQYRIVREPPGLAVEVPLRSGRTLEGCSLQLTDYRPHGLGFDVRVPLRSPQTLVPIPHDVDELEVRLFTRDNEPVFYRRAHFLRQISMSVGLAGRVERSVRDRRDPAVVHRVPVQGSDRPVRSSVGTPAPRGTTLLRSAEAARRAGEPDPTVRVFPKGSESNARAFVREVLGKATKRCMVCDPYLGPGDPYDYATFVRQSQLPIQLLGSAERARRITEPAWRPTLARNEEFVCGRTVGEALNDEIRSLLTQDTTLRIVCRVLRGNKSPIHDRFIVVDDAVYALGSSLNEFGSRMTTSVRIPKPQELLAALNEYWNSDSYSESIEDWVARRQALSGNT